MDPADTALEEALYAAMDEVLEEGKIQVPQPQPQPHFPPCSDHNATYILLDNGPDTSAPPVETWLGLYCDGPDSPYEFCRRCYTRWPPEPVSWFQDDFRDELCCGGCGSVRAERAWPVTAYSSCHKYTNLPSKSKSAGVLCRVNHFYTTDGFTDKRRYHFHERLSQRNNTDPVSIFRTRILCAHVVVAASTLCGGTTGCCVPRQRHRRQSDHHAVRLSHP